LKGKIKMDKEINEILKSLDQSMKHTLESDPRSLKNPESEYGYLFDHIHKWREMIHRLWVDEEDTNIDYQKAKKVADNIINYLSKNYDDFSMIDLMIKCEKENILNYPIILNPTTKNYLNANDETLTKIVQTYDKNLIVRDNIIIRVNKKEENDIQDQERILNLNQNTKNYASLISEAIDKLDNYAGE